MLDEQDPLQVADAYLGKPDKSRLRYAGERPLHKPTTDVVLIGKARADRPDCRQLDVSLRAGPISKTVRVFGDRVWVTLGTAFPSAPARFESIPLVHERAFGGVDEGAGERWATNPVGVGFRGKGSKLPLEGTPLPNLEHPKQLIRGAKDRAPPAGFGFVAPSWEPRLQFAGTYGAAWLENHAPLLPPDYDDRFQQVAPADQICPAFLRGGEPVEVTNASPGGRMAFALPAPQLRIELQVSGDTTPLEVNLDTVVVDGDREVVSITWRGHRVRTRAGSRPGGGARGGRADRVRGAAGSALAITGLGMRCAVGQNARQSAAATRAGICRFGEWPPADPGAAHDGGAPERVAAAVTPDLGRLRLDREAGAIGDPAVAGGAVDGAA